jgi:cytoskeletal protein CcmA (bactofilin family)
MSAQDEQHEETVEINTLLGSGSHFEGKLTFAGTVRIDGEFSGEIFSDDILVVGEGGHINAKVEIGSMVIEGTVDGDIHAKRSVEIHAPGLMRGNIVTPSLFIDRGVVFQGSCQMVDESQEQVSEQVMEADPPPDDDPQPLDTIGNIERSGIIDASNT